MINKCFQAVTSSQSQLDGFGVGGRDPAFGDQAFSGDIQVEHVQSVVNGLDLPHFDEPNLERTRHLEENSSKVHRPRGRDL